jgi:hypothetical protein
MWQLLGIQRDHRWISRPLSAYAPPVALKGFLKASRERVITIQSLNFVGSTFHAAVWYGAFFGRSGEKKKKRKEKKKVLI